MGGIYDFLVEAKKYPFAVTLRVRKNAFDDGLHFEMHMTFHTLQYGNGAHIPLYIFQKSWISDVFSTVLSGYTTTAIMYKSKTRCNMVEIYRIYVDKSQNLLLCGFIPQTLVWYISFSRQHM